MTGLETKVFGVYATTPWSTPAMATTPPWARNALGWRSGESAAGSNPSAARLAALSYPSTNKSRLAAGMKPLLPILTGTRSPLPSKSSVVGRRL